MAKTKSYYVIILYGPGDFTVSVIKALSPKSAVKAVVAPELIGDIVKVKSTPLYSHFKLSVWGSPDYIVLKKG